MTKEIESQASLGSKIDLPKRGEIANIRPARKKKIHGPGVQRIFSRRKFEDAYLGQKKKISWCW